MRTVLVILVVLAVMVIAAFGFAAWKINHLKQELVADLESQLHATAQITSLQFDARKGEVHAAGISLVNQQADAPWDTAAIDQVTIHLHLMDLFASVLPLQIEASGWKINLRTPNAQSSLPSTPGIHGSSMADVSSHASGDGASERVRVTALSAANGEVMIASGEQPIDVRGVEFTAENHGGAQWTTHLQATSINAGTLVAGTSSVDLRSDTDKIAFDKLTVRCGDGAVAGSGEIGLNPNHAVHGTFTANLMPITMLVATRWQMKVAGFVNGSLTYQGDATSASATGHLSVSQGRLSLFPWLGKVTLLVGMPDVTNLDVDVATCDVAWKDHLLTLQNIDVRKTDVLRLSGTMTVAPDGICDGQLKLGLPVEMVAKVPRLETEIFSQQVENFDWTDVHVTGAPDHLQEDLSPRLVTVAAEETSDLLKSSTQKASTFLNNLLR